MSPPPSPDSQPTSPATPKPAPNTRSLIPSSVTQILKNWLLHPRNITRPYPSPSEKIALSEATSLSIKQINCWFTNNRKRVWRREVNRGELENNNNNGQFGNFGGNEGHINQQNMYPLSYPMPNPAFDNQNNNNNNIPNPHQQGPYSGYNNNYYVYPNNNPNIQAMRNQPMNYLPFNNQLMNQQMMNQSMPGYRQYHLYNQNNNGLMPMPMHMNMNMNMNMNGMARNAASYAAYSAQFMGGGNVIETTNTNTNTTNNKSNKRKMSNNQLDSSSSSSPLTLPNKTLKSDTSSSSSSSSPSLSPSSQQSPQGLAQGQGQQGQAQVDQSSTLNNDNLNEIGNNGAIIATPDCSSSSALTVYNHDRSTAGDVQKNQFILDHIKMVEQEGQTNIASMEPTVAPPFSSSSHEEISTTVSPGPASLSASTSTAQDHTDGETCIRKERLYVYVLKDKKPPNSSTKNTPRWSPTINDLSISPPTQTSPNLPQSSQKESSLKTSLNTTIIAKYGPLLMEHTFPAEYLKRDVVVERKKIQSKRGAAVVKLKKNVLDVFLAKYEEDFESYRDEDEDGDGGGDGGDNSSSSSVVKRDGNSGRKEKGKDVTGAGSEGGREDENFLLRDAVLLCSVGKADEMK